MYHRIFNNNSKNNLAALCIHNQLVCVSRIPVEVMFTWLQPALDSS